MKKYSAVFAGILLVGAGCATSEERYSSAQWDDSNFSSGTRVAGSGNQMQGDLNASPQLERNMSGEYSVGAPGGTQSGMSSSDAAVSSSDSIHLFRNNRAQGVGSAASGEVEMFTPGGNENNGSSLSQRVKGILTREGTGTYGMMAPDIRDVQVTSSDDGVVTLKGSVPTEQDKQIVEIRAREVQGVQRVDNQLTVEGRGASPASQTGSGHDLEDRTDRLQDIQP